MKGRGEGSHGASVPGCLWPLAHLQDAQIILGNTDENWKWLVMLMNIDTYLIGKAQL